MNSLRLRSNAGPPLVGAAGPLLFFAPTITHGRKSLHRGTHYTGAMVVAGQSITGQPALFPSSPQSNPTHAVSVTSAGRLTDTHRLAYYRPAPPFLPCAGLSFA